MSLINREALIAEYDRVHIGEPGKARKLIEDAPTIEPERTGKWVEQDDGWDGVYYECSICKEPFTLIDGTPSDNLYNYCPNCGARMES